MFWVNLQVFLCSRFCECWLLACECWYLWWCVCLCGWTHVTLPWDIIVFNADICACILSQINVGICPLHSSMPSLHPSLPHCTVRPGAPSISNTAPFIIDCAEKKEKKADVMVSARTVQDLHLFCQPPPDNQTFCFFCCMMIYGHWIFDCTTHHLFDSI